MGDQRHDTEATGDTEPRGADRRPPGRIPTGTALVVLIVLGLALQAFWLEPRQLLLRDQVDLQLLAGAEDGGAASSPLLHLSDLHIRGETPVLRRLLEAARLEEPGWIVISGDLVGSRGSPGDRSRYLAAARSFFGELARVAPVLAVQGHSDYRGDELAALAGAGVRWLSNEGLRLGPDGPLLLGLNEQVGEHALPAPDGRLHLPYRPSFRPRRIGGAAGEVSEGGETHPHGEGAGAWAWGIDLPREPPGSDNLYAHFDPHFEPHLEPRFRSGTENRAPRPGAGKNLARTDGPLAWSGYEVRCELLLDRPGAGAGVVAHSRFVAGEDRMIRLRRVSEGEGSGTFELVVHGSGFTAGTTDTGVAPEAGRWYRLRLRTEVPSDRVVVRAKVWPADEDEPATWQAEAEDASTYRITEGTVGLWAWERGGVAYRHLEVVETAGSEDGSLLLVEGLDRPEDPPGWHSGARGSRLEMALARSPAAPPAVPRIVLSHTPGAVLEAAHRGMDAVLAGHTHGGQVRLPFVGALITRSTLGPYYDRGAFRFSSIHPRGWTTLYVSPGVGTSILPVRFFNPPRYAVVVP